MNGEELPPAVPVFLEWLRERDLTPHAFAIANRIDPSTVSKILNGKQGVSLDLAFRIQEATDGVVALPLWRRS